MVFVSKSEQWLSGIEWLKTGQPLIDQTGRMSGGGLYITPPPPPLVIFPPEV